MAGEDEKDKAEKIAAAKKRVGCPNTMPRDSRFAPRLIPRPR